MKKIVGTLIALTGGIIIGAMAGAFVMNKLSSSMSMDKEKKIDKFKRYYNLLLQWVSKKQDSKDFSEYFIDKGYKKIAIYGMGEIGFRLYEELKNSDIEIKYAVDKSSNLIDVPFEVLDPEELIDDEIDVLVITAAFAFEELQEELSDKISCPIISIEDIVYDL